MCIRKNRKEVKWCISVSHWHVVPNVINFICSKCISAMPSFWCHRWIDCVKWFCKTSHYHFLGCLQESYYMQLHTRCLKSSAASFNSQLSEAVCLTFPNKLVVLPQPQWLCSHDLIFPFATHQRVCSCFDNTVSRLKRLSGEQSFIFKRARLRFAIRDFLRNLLIMLRYYLKIIRDCIRAHYSLHQRLPNFFGSSLPSPLKISMRLPPNIGLGNQVTKRLKLFYYTKAFGGRGGITPTHSQPRHKMGVLVSVMPRPHFSRGESTPGTGGWVDPRAGLDTEVGGKIFSPLLRIECWGSKLDRLVVQPVDTLYSMTYPGS
jgi:hypothetical protein